MRVQKGLFPQDLDNFSLTFRVAFRSDQRKARTITRREQDFPEDVILGGMLDRCLAIKLSFVLEVKVIYK
jgi:hypothetical protein